MKLAEESHVALLSSNLAGVALMCLVAGLLTFRLRRRIILLRREEKDPMRKLASYTLLDTMETKNLRSVFEVVLF